MHLTHPSLAYKNSWIYDSAILPDIDKLQRNTRWSYC